MYGASHFDKYGVRGRFTI